MGAINVSYNSDMIYDNVIDNTIILKNKETKETVYTLPIPKNFQIVGKEYYEGENRPCYVITPYKLNQPKFIPIGYRNLCLGMNGLWMVDNGKRWLSYIDTTILSEKDYEYPTLGSFKISKEEIPEPFWIPELHPLECCTKTSDYICPSKISALMKQYGEDVRLIYEEELVSIFALSKFGTQFSEVLPENMYTDYFFRNPKQYYTCLQDICLDNWDLLVASREDRNAYKMIYSEATRDWNEEYWFRVKNYTNTDRVHIWPVFENPEIKEKQSIQFVKKK